MVSKENADKNVLSQHGDLFI